MTWAVFTEVNGRPASKQPIIATTKQQADKIADGILDKPLPAGVEMIATAVVCVHEVDKYLKFFE